MRRGMYGASPASPPLPFLLANPYANLIANLTPYVLGRDRKASRSIVSALVKPRSLSRFWAKKPRLKFELQSMLVLKFRSLITSDSLWYQGLSEEGPKLRFRKLLRPC